MTTNEIFAETLLDSFDSPKFFRALAQGTEIDYNEARSTSLDEDMIAEELKRYKFGHDRYFLSQSRFIRCARQSGLAVKVKRCPQNDYPIFVVEAKPFSFTFHYGAKPSEITYQNISLVRRQNTAINSEIVQPSLFSKPSFDLDKLKDAEEIYANIIHGCGGNGLNFAENGFLRIAIPTIKLTGGKESFIFVSDVNLFDILQSLEEREATQTQAVPMVDTAMPRVKKQL